MLPPGERDAQVAVILEADRALEPDEALEAAGRLAAPALAVADEAEKVVRIGVARLLPDQARAGLRGRLELPHAEQADGLGEKTGGRGGHDGGSM